MGMKTYGIWWNIDEHMGGFREVERVFEAYFVGKSNVVEVLGLKHTQGLSNGTWDVRKAGKKGWEGGKDKKTVWVESRWLHTVGLYKREAKIQEHICGRGY